MLFLPGTDDSSDPEASKTLQVLGAAVLVVLTVAFVIGSKDLRDDALKVGGGLLVVLGSYYTARSLAESRVEHRGDQMLKAIELLASERPEVRCGAGKALVEIAHACGHREIKRIQAIKTVLTAIQEGRLPGWCLTSDEIKALDTLPMQPERIWRHRPQNGSTARLTHAGEEAGDARQP